MEAVRVLRHTTTEFKLKQFFQGGSSQGSGFGKSRHQPQSRYNPYQNQRSFSPRRTFRRLPPEGEDNEQYLRPPKGDTVPVIDKNCTNVLHRLNVIKDNAHCTPTTTALQWVQQNLSPLTSLVNKCPAGHLHLAASNWMKVTSDPWVLNTIQGYRIEFWAQPRQTHPPIPLPFSQKETLLMKEGIHKLLVKQAVSVVTSPCNESFLSRIFLVPKKDDSQRPVINLHQLNQFVIWEHFKMENIHLVQNLIQEETGWYKDLKDAYFSIPINQEYRR